MNAQSEVRVAAGSSIKDKKEEEKKEDRDQPTNGIRKQINK